jgi:hypothetical protein
MPLSQLKLRARSEESCVAFVKILLKNLQQSTLRASWRSTGVRPAGPSGKLVVFEIRKSV